MKGFANALYQLSITALLMPLLTVTSRAQNSDRLVGTWNLRGTQDGAVITIAVMTFNAGGTTVEFDTAGTNSSSSPGESIDLGVWKKTGARLTPSKKRTPYTILPGT